MQVFSFLNEFQLVSEHVRPHTSWILCIVRHFNKNSDLLLVLLGHQEAEFQTRQAGQAAWLNLRCHFMISSGLIFIYLSSVSAFISCSG